MEKIRKDQEQVKGSVLSSFDSRIKKKTRVLRV